MRAFLLLLALPLLFVTAAAAATPSLAAPFAPAQEPGEDALEDHMLLMESAMKRLRRSLRDPEKRDDSLGYLVKMQEAALAAKQLQPRMTAGVPEEERAAFLAAYRRDAAVLLRSLVELEIAVLEGDEAKAKELYDRLAELEETGHERFTEDE